MSVDKIEGIIISPPEIKELTTSEYFDIIWRNKYLLYSSILILILFVIRIFFINKKSKENKTIYKKQIVKCIILYGIAFIIKMMRAIDVLEDCIWEERGMFSELTRSISILLYYFHFCFALDFINNRINNR